MLTTTRSVRRRLDFDRPVDRSALMRCLEWAVQAPNGSNRQGWTWVFVDDTDRKRAIADVYRRNFEQLIGTAYADAAAEMRRSIDAGRHLATNDERCPMPLVPFVDGRHDGADAPPAAGMWGSILPAVWSFVLALREHGLGTAWTTVHLGWGGEREVADVVGAPYERATQVGLFPIAHTVGTDFRPAPRGGRAHDRAVQSRGAAAPARSRRRGRHRCAACQHAVPRRCDVVDQRRRVSAPYRFPSAGLHFPADPASLPTVAPVETALGAEVGNVDLRAELTDAQVGAIRDALLRRKVLLFRAPGLTLDEHLRFAARFGEVLVDHPVLGAGPPDHPGMLQLSSVVGGGAAAAEPLWHADITVSVDPTAAPFRRVPPPAWRRSNAQVR